MHLDLSDVLRPAVADLESALSAAFPTASFLVRLYAEDCEGPHVVVDWSDGPSLDAVRSCLEPLSTVSVAIFFAGRSLTLSSPVLALNRTFSAETMFALVGLEVLASGLPPLPDAAMCISVDVPWTSPLPYDAQRISRLVPAVLSEFRTFSTHPLSSLAKRVSVPDSSLDLADPGSLYAGLSPLDRAQVECFVTLCSDAGLAPSRPFGLASTSAAGAALYAAAGGWDLASAAALSTASAVSPGP